mgnify:CR=1 FL=1
MGKHNIRVYDKDGNFVENVKRTVYFFNYGRSVHYGQYWGVNYKNSRPSVYGDSEHPNGLYIFGGDFSSQPNEEMKRKIHAQHTYDKRDIVSLKRNVA